MAFAWARKAYVEFFFSARMTYVARRYNGGLGPRDKSGYCARFVVRYCLAGGGEGVKKKEKEGKKTMASSHSCPSPHCA